MSQCRQCGSTTPDIDYCHNCTTAFQNSLRSLRLGLPTLRLIAAKRASVVARSTIHGNRSTAPIPLNMTAFQLQEDITVFAQRLSRALTLRYGHSMPAEALLKACEQRVPAILHRHDSPSIITISRHLAHNLHQQLNPPEDRRLIGTCPHCARQLWLTDTEIHAQWTVCNCGTTLKVHDIQEQHLLRVALADNPNAQGTAAAISRLLHVNGIDVKRWTISQWKKRGLLNAVGFQDGKPVYRVWDVWRLHRR